jgi:hypothetical protein
VNDVPNGPSRRRRVGVAAGLLGAGIAAGAVAATAIGASAQSGSGSSSPGASSPPSASSASGPAGAPNRPPDGGRGSAPVRPDEKSLSAAITATLKAAALKAVPGGTVYRVESDAGDAAYEAHMAKADGTPVTVKFDKNLKVTKVEAGMGEGDPAPGGHPGGPR